MIERTDKFLLKIKELIEKYVYICLFIIFAVFLLSRLLRLGSLPYGVNVDEVAIGLEGKYISEYGMDRHLDRMPPYFKNYGGGMSALYVYILALLFKVFPYSIVMIRIPAVLCGILCFFYSYRLINELFSDKVAALLGPIFVTILPFYMSSERWGLDCNLFLSIMTVALFYFIKALKSGESKYYVLAGVWMGITLYTYAISYPVIIVFLAFSFIYMIVINQFEIKKVIIFAIPLAILALPLIMFQLVNMGIVQEFSFLGSDYHKLTGYRAAEISLSNIPGNIKFIGVLLFGGDGLNYNAFDIITYGTVYAFMPPIIIIGLVWMIVDVIKKTYKDENGFDSFTIVLLFFAASMGFTMLLWAPSINKANEVFLTFMIFVVYAVVKLTQKLSVIAPVILAVSAIFFLLYSKFYFMDQIEYYGYHILFYGTPSYDIIKYVEDTYNPDGSKTVYLEQEYADQGAEAFILSAYKDIPPSEFSTERTEFGNVRLHFPEYDENEDAIYILGYTWNHISGYLAENGFNVDTTFPNYLILYR